MTGRLSVLAVVLGLAGCTGLGAGTATVAAPEERESAALYLWSKRGMDAGELARVYCLQGSSRERRWMRESFEHHAVPAKVTIECPE